MKLKRAPNSSQNSHSATASTSRRKDAPKKERKGSGGKKEAGGRGRGRGGEPQHQRRDREDRRRQVEPQAAREDLQQGADGQRVIRLRGEQHARQHADKDEAGAGQDGG